jgi:predicted RNA methylase
MRNNPHIFTIQQKYSEACPRNIQEVAVIHSKMERFLGKTDIFNPVTV